MLIPTSSTALLATHLRTALPGLVLSLFTLATPPQLDAQILINEVLALNHSTIANDGSFPDYVELINLSAQPAELSGPSLTDDPGVPRAFVFPAGVSLAALRTDSDSSGWI